MLKPIEQIVKDVTVEITDSIMVEFAKSIEDRLTMERNWMRNRIIIACVLTATFVSAVFISILLLIGTV